jgi:hypothetical protein
VKETTMATMTKATMLDMMTKANKVVEAALAKERAANQAVLDAEKALVLAREARYAASREVAAANEAARKVATDIKGNEVTSGIDFSKASSSYSGAAGRCCCGCAGNHSESPVAVKRQINRIKRLAAEGIELDVQPTYVAAEKDGRLYIVYLEAK